MVAIRVDNFAGMAPRVSDRLLPYNFAALATNCHLIDGNLEAQRFPAKLAEFSVPYVVTRVYRIPDTPDDKFIGFENEETDVVPGQLVNDAFDRYYKTDGSTPQYNTRSRILQDLPWLNLGVDQPDIVGAGTSITPTGGVEPVETRAYVFTFQTEYGEEGQSSLPISVSGPPDASWDISLIPQPADPVGPPAITSINIFRTVTGQAGGVEFYFVDSVSAGTTSYSDTKANLEIVVNRILQSETWTKPPDGLLGLIGHPNGFFVAFKGRDLYMSVPFQPHAWPDSFILSTETNIVAVGIWGQSICIATESQPYVATGIRPDGLSLQKFDMKEPCSKRRSMVSMDDGVYYASVNGLIRITAAGVVNVTLPWVDQHEWQEFFFPFLIDAARERTNKYIGWTTFTQGFIINPQEQRSAFTYVSWDRGITGVIQDIYSADVIIVSQNIAYIWDPWYTSYQTYDWLSKEFDLPKPINFGALEMKFRDTQQINQLDPATLLELTDYNTKRFAAGPLNTLNNHAINGVRVYPNIVSGVVQSRQPLGGSPLYDLDYFNQTPAGASITVFADGQEVFYGTAYANGFTKKVIFRLPDGFKSDLWQMRINGSGPLASVAIAETRKELATL